MTPEQFKERVGYWAEKVGVEPARVQIQEMKNKWASCSTSGRLTFSADLLDEDMNFAEYVIIHELLHLQIPNHGKLFKSLMRSFAHEYEEYAKNRLVCGVSNDSN